MPGRTPFQPYDKSTFGNVRQGNYAQFEDDGSLRFFGTATGFLDEANQLIGKRLESPSSDIVQDNAEAAIYYKDSATLVDYVSMTVQFNHDRKATASVSPHIHWWQTESSVPNWMIQYRWQVNGSAKTTSWTSAKLSSHAFTYSSGTMNQITGFGDITPPTGDGVSTIIQVRLLRDTNNDSTLFAGADPVTGNQYAVSMDVHKEIDSPCGSRQEYVK